MKIQFTQDELCDAIIGHIKSVGLSANITRDDISFSQTRNPVAISAEVELHPDGAPKPTKDSKREGSDKAGNSNVEPIDKVADKVTSAEKADADVANESSEDTDGAPEQSAASEAEEETTTSLFG